MVSNRARVAWGACFGGLIGLAIGAVGGGLIANPPRFQPDPPPQNVSGTNPAAGLMLLLKPVEAVANTVSLIIGVFLGGTFGTMAGGIIGASLATGMIPEPVHRLEFADPPSERGRLELD